MTDPLESAIQQYAELPRPLHADARFYMSEGTADALRRRYASYINGPVMPSTMLGIPVIIDDTLPFGAVELRHESPFEKMLREARASGVSINVVKPIYSAPEVLPPPKPTLRALLRHWAKKLRNR